MFNNDPTAVLTTPRCALCFIATITTAIAAPMIAGLIAFGLATWRTYAWLAEARIERTTAIGSTDYSDFERHALDIRPTVCLSAARIFGFVFVVIFITGGYQLLFYRPISKS